MSLNRLKIYGFVVAVVVVVVVDSVVVVVVVVAVITLTFSSGMIPFGIFSVVCSK
jgi:hypothetical protein